MTDPVADANGTCIWLKDGKVHRTDGPAAIYPNGEQRWYVDGKAHRTDGPAIIYSDGSQYWYVDGKAHRTSKSYQEAANLSDEDMIVMTLKYGVVSHTSNKYE